MDIEKLRAELIYFETMLSLTSKTTSNPDDWAARAIYESLITDTRKKLEQMELQASEAATPRSSLSLRNRLFK